MAVNDLEVKMLAMQTLESFGQAKYGHLASLKEYDEVWKHDRQNAITKYSYQELLEAAIDRLKTYGTTNVTAKHIADCLYKWLLAMDVNRKAKGQTTFYLVESYDKRIPRTV